MSDFADDLKQWFQDGQQEYARDGRRYMIVWWNTFDHFGFATYVFSREEVVCVLNRNRKMASAQIVTDVYDLTLPMEEGRLSPEMFTSEPVEEKRT